MTNKNKMNDTFIKHIVLDDNNRYIRVPLYGLTSNDYSPSDKHSVLQAIAITALMITIVLAFSKAFVRAIDISISNQDTMLCESAKISGNTEYLNKCECYYQSGDISCLQGR